MARVNDIPFDSERKMMTTIHKYGNKYRIITKGAPDVLIKKCNNYIASGLQKSITAQDITNIEIQNN